MRRLAAAFGRVTVGATVARVVTTGADGLARTGVATVGAAARDATTDGAAVVGVAIAGAVVAGAGIGGATTAAGSDGARDGATRPTTASAIAVSAAPPSNIILLLSLIHI